MSAEKESADAIMRTRRKSKETARAFASDHAHHEQKGNSLRSCDRFVG